MNDIERAIAYLEPIGKHPTLTGDYCKYLNIALSALREKQERNAELTRLREQLEAAKADINAMVDETGNPCAYCKKNPCVPANDKCTGFVWRGEKEEKA